MRKDEIEPPMKDDGEGSDDRARLRRSLAGLALAIVLVLVGLYLILRLHRANEMEMCLEAGHHDCDSLLDRPW